MSRHSLSDYLDNASRVREKALNKASIGQVKGNPEGKRAWLGEWLARHAELEKR